MLALPRRAICSSESQKGKKLLTSAISNAWKIHNAIKVCNIKGPKCMHSHNGCICKKKVFCEYLCVFQECICIYIGAIWTKKFLVSPQVSLKTKSVVILDQVAFEEKPFLVSHQVSLKTKSTLVAFEEKTFLVSP